LFLYLAWNFLKANVAFLVTKWKVDPVTGRKGNGAVGQKWKVEGKKRWPKDAGVELGCTVNNLQGVGLRKEVW